MLNVEVIVLKWEPSPMIMCRAVSSRILTPTKVAKRCEQGDASKAAVI